MLFPSAKPSLRWLMTRRTSGYAARMASAKPSDEALSTTKISRPGPVESANDARQRNVSALRFQFTMMTATLSFGESIFHPVVVRPPRHDHDTKEAASRTRARFTGWLTE